VRECNRRLECDVRVPVSEPTINVSPIRVRILVILQFQGTLTEFMGILTKIIECTR
jgi:hypothetical protein